MTEKLYRYIIESDRVELHDYQSYKIWEGGDIESVEEESFDTLEEAQARFDKCYYESEVNISKSIIGKNLYNIKRFNLIRIEYEVINGEEEELDREYLAQSKDNFDF